VRDLERIPPSNSVGQKRAIRMYVRYPKCLFEVLKLGVELQSKDDTIPPPSRCPPTAFIIAFSGTLTA